MEKSWQSLKEDFFGEKEGKITACLNQDFLVKLKRKKKMDMQWKQRQVS